MNKITKNNQDYLFRVSEFIREYAVLDEIVISDIPTDVKRFVHKLVDDYVIDENYEVKLTESLIMTLTIMIDNPKTDKFD